MCYIPNAEAIKITISEIAILKIRWLGRMCNPMRCNSDPCTNEAY